MANYRVPIFPKGYLPVMGPAPIVLCNSVLYRNPLKTPIDSGASGLYDSVQVLLGQCGSVEMGGLGRSFMIFSISKRRVRRLSSLNSLLPTNDRAILLADLITRSHTPPW